MNKWVLFTKRTNEPKLSWLERQLDAAGIPHRRNRESWHAPIMEVPKDRLNEAWDILTPVDNIADDDPQFGDDPEKENEWEYLWENHRREPLAPDTRLPNQCSGVVVCF